MVCKTSLQDCLLDSAKEVFETMIFMDLQEADENEHLLEGATYLGVISFKGLIEGCLGICCSDKCAATVAANMLGLDPDGTIEQQDIKDAIGEVCNMVLGSFKAKAQEHVEDIQVSVPTVIRGRELDNNMISHAQKILLKINIEGEYFAEFTLLFRQCGI